MVSEESKILTKSPGTKGVPKMTTRKNKLMVCAIVFAIMLTIVFYLSSQTNQSDESVEVIKSDEEVCYEDEYEGFEEIKIIPNSIEENITESNDDDTSINQNTRSCNNDTVNPTPAVESPPDLVDDSSTTNQVHDNQSEPSQRSGEEQVNNPENPNIPSAPVSIIEPVTNISMSTNRSNSLYKVGDIGLVSVVVFPSNATDKNYNLSTSDQSILTISQNGQFTAKSQGSVTVTAISTNGVKREILIEVLDMNILASDVLTLVNNERSKNSVALLSANNTLLNASAVKRAEEIMTNFSHIRPDGRGQSTVYEDNGGTFIGHYSETGENIAAGHKSPTEVVAAWMSSRKNKANILDSNYTSIGVSVNMDDSGRLFWVQSFYG